MKTTIILLIVLLGTKFALKAQEISTQKKKIFKVTLVGNIAGKGYIAAIQDSGLYLSSKPVFFNMISSEQNTAKVIDYEELGSLMVKRKGSAGRGYLIGVVTGALGGALAGFASGKDGEYENTVGSIGGVPIYTRSYTAGQKAGVGAIVFGFTGGIVGFIAGALSGKNFVIDGDKDKFITFRSNLIKRTHKHKTSRRN